VKIAISTEGGSVSAHFGRCPSYTIVDIRDGKVVGREEIPNPGHSPGFLPGFLHEKGVETIIAGGMGPRAQGLFAEKNIRTVIGAAGPVDEVVGLFLRGELEPGPDLCDHGHQHEGPHRHDSPPAGRDILLVAGGRVCVSAKGGDLDAELDPRFGRAPYFLLVDPDTLDFEAFKNPHGEAPHGAGIQAAQLVAEKHPVAVLTGQVGPNAARVLESAGIQVISTDQCSVRDAVTRLKTG
jgi:predicted Fe-Mo cluster-binding NifX family protein